MSTTRRRRSQPWIYRRSRLIIGTIAIIGAILTAYLAITSLTGGQVACSADANASAGCNDVLSTRYATVFGLPLSLFGCLGYLAMATFSLSPFAINIDKNGSLREQAEELTWLFLLIGSVAMATFSSYLMYLLAFEIKQLCLYCIASAIFSLSMLVLTVIGRDWEDIGQIFFTGAIVGLVTLIGTLAIYSMSGDLIAIDEPTTEPVAPNGWEITMESGAAEIALAKHLKQMGVKKYGAYWCPHCYEQKQLFGKEAWKEIEYIECASDGKGKNPQPDLCREKGIQSFPTWEIKGKLDPGVKVLSKLAAATEYKGNSAFKYRLP
jgi:uncharacterized membrane protein